MADLHEVLLDFGVRSCDEPDGPGRTRTSDTRFRKPVLYPLSYEAASEG